MKKTPRYTINQFRKEFPTDDSCLDRIFELRYSKYPCCPQCYQQTTFKRLSNRRAYQCSDKDCQYQLYPTAGTVFEKTRTSLKDWFYAMYLMTSTRNGVSAKELERQLGVTYKTAWRMGHQIRKLMANTGKEMISGIVEADETYIGGLAKNRHFHKRNDPQEYKPVLAMVARSGEVRVEVLEDVRVENVTAALVKHVSKESILITDSHVSYPTVGKKYKKHISIKHTNSDPSLAYKTIGDSHTNTVEGFFSHLKRAIKGTHIMVSKKHLHLYACECAFKYSYRAFGQKMFYTMLDRAV